MTIIIKLYILIYIQSELMSELQNLKQTGYKMKKPIILNKLQMIRINFLEKQGVFALMGAVELADKLAITNGYFFTNTLPMQFPVTNVRGA